MAPYTAIADVSETLLGILQERLAATDRITMDAETVALASPDAVTEESSTRLSLSLYRIEENPSMKNTDLNQDSDPTVSQGSPLALDLYYVLTAYPAGTDDDATTRTVGQQRLLGLAMQTFHDNAVLDTDQLQGPLDADVGLRISLVNSSTEELSTLWTTVPDTAFQPSALYHVGPVLIDSQQHEEITAVTDRETAVNRTPDS